MKKFPVLYKRAKSGKIQEWSIRVESNMEGASFVGEIITEQGQIDGKKQKYKETVQFGKNVGKSNQTTPYEQAYLEAESKWKKKKDEGYKSLVDLGFDGEITETHTLKSFLEEKLPKFNTDAEGRPKPMLAHKYEDHKDKIKFPCFGQPKLNGVRCLAYLVEEKNGLFIETKVILLSRDGKEYNVEHIQRELLELFIDNPSFDKDMVFDGELYIHGLPLNQIVSAIKKPNSNTSKIEYHIYDLAIEEVNQKNRDKYLIDILALRDLKSIKMVTTEIIKEEDYILELHSSLKSKGYEGLMLRNWDGVYSFGSRSKDLLKVKSWKEEEFTIVGGELGTRGTEDMVFCLITEDNKEFKAKPKGTREEKEEYWNRVKEGELYGKKATVKFFEYTEYGVPFHGHVVTVRDYE